MPKGEITRFCELQKKFVPSSKCQNCELQCINLNGKNVHGGTGNNHKIRVK